MSWWHYVDLRVIFKWMYCFGKQTFRVTLYKNHDEAAKKRTSAWFVFVYMVKGRKETTIKLGMRPLLVSNFLADNLDWSLLTKYDSSEEVPENFTHNSNSAEEKPFRLLKYNFEVEQKFSIMEFLYCCSMVSKTTFLSWTLFEITPVYVLIDGLDE